MSEVQLDAMAEMLNRESGLATVATIRNNGEPLLSIVNASVMKHPVTNDLVVAFVSGGSAARLGHIRGRGHLSVLVRRSWRWASASGTAEIIGPDDNPGALEGIDHDMKSLLRSVFTEAGGTHEDWSEFDRVMSEERRCAIFLSPTATNSN